MTVDDILAENARRRSVMLAPYDPIAGDSSDPGRRPLLIAGLAEGTLHLPASMFNTALVASLSRHGSIDSYIHGELHATPSEATRRRVRRDFLRLRILHDFPYWAARFVYIKNKDGGPDMLFTLNRTQRKLVARLESMRLAGRPIRLILLKARQWGGSTCVQIYMAWLQLVHSEGLNSLIIAHQATATDEIKDMFDRMLRHYPEWLLNDEADDGSGPDDSTPPEECRSLRGRMERVGSSGMSFRVVARNCKVKLGSAERPDSCRGGDYSLVHCSEVGMWRKTLLKTPAQIIRAACSGVLLKAMTMIVMESTANGTGNYFHEEYQAASKGTSQSEALFVAWYEIERYTMPLEDPRAFAASLLEGRDATQPLSSRCQPGAYLWWLWEKGATLEAIRWYVAERAKYSDHGEMASEYPSDDVEAFAHSGARVFGKYHVEELRKSCCVVPVRGEIYGDAPDGREALQGLRFTPDPNGALTMWRDRELPDEGMRVLDRYLVVVDVGGRSLKADWSVVAVFDRIAMGMGGKPEIVAQWRGHTDTDLLAWNAARIAAYYCNALLVIESNTIETHDPERFTDGDQSQFIFSQLRDCYHNLYARRQSEEDVTLGLPRKYGFHTNVATKPMVISGLVKAVREGLYVERDEQCLNELLTYEQRQNGSYGAISGCHDDLLMTRAIGLHICFNEMPIPRRVILGFCRPRRSTVGGIWL